MERTPHHPDPTTRLKQTLKISLQSQSEAGLVFGKKKKSKDSWGATGRHCPISRFIVAITVVPALNQRLIVNLQGSSLWLFENRMI